MLTSFPLYICKNFVTDWLLFIELGQLTIAITNKKGYETFLHQISDLVLDCNVRMKDPSALAWILKYNVIPRECNVQFPLLKVFKNQISCVSLYSLFTTFINSIAYITHQHKSISKKHTAE